MKTIKELKETIAELKSENTLLIDQCSDLEARIVENNHENADLQRAFEGQVKDLESYVLTLGGSREKIDEINKKYF